MIVRKTFKVKLLCISYILVLMLFLITVFSETHKLRNSTNIEPLYHSLVYRYSILNEFKIIDYLSHPELATLEPSQTRLGYITNIKIILAKANFSKKIISRLNQNNINYEKDTESTRHILNEINLILRAQGLREISNSEITTHMSDSKEINGELLKLDIISTSKHHYFMIWYFPKSSF